MIGRRSSAGGGSGNIVSGDPVVAGGGVLNRVGGCYLRVGGP